MAGPCGARAVAAALARRAAGTARGVCSAPGVCTAPGFCSVRGVCSVPGVGTPRGVCSAPGVGTAPGFCTARGVCTAPGICSAAAQRPWKLFGAMCLLRLPRITQPLEKEEEEVAALMEQIELEKSLYSDHEMRKLEEEEQLKRKMESSYDEDEAHGKTVIMAQDLEEKWEQRFLQFKAAPRITDADKSNDRTSLNRKLDSNLMFLVKQKIGNQELWLLPQVEWQPGETLRSTAERAMATFLGDRIQAKVLGNAPYGIYKYKFPRAIRTENNVGAKVFFFKAFLQSSDLSQAELKADYLWVTKKELGDYLKSEYLKKVNRFLLDL